MLDSTLVDQVGVWPPRPPPPPTETPQATSREVCSQSHLTSSTQRAVTRTTLNPDELRTGCFTGTWNTSATAQDDDFPNPCALNLLLKSLQEGEVCPQQLSLSLLGYLTVSPANSLRFTRSCVAGHSSSAPNAWS